MTRVQMERTQSSVAANVGARRAQSGELPDEFRKILRDKPENSKESAEDAKAEKEDASREEDAPVKETKESVKPEEMLYTFGVDQLAREMQTPVFTEEQVEMGVVTPVIPETDFAAVQPTAEEIPQLAKEGEGMPVETLLSDQETQVQLADAGTVQTKAEPVQTEVVLTTEERPVQETVDVPKDLTETATVAQDTQAVQGSAVQQTAKSEGQTEKKEDSRDGEEQNPKASLAGVNPQRSYTNVHRTSYEGTQEVVHAATPEEFAEGFPKSLISNITQGKNEFEILLEPANLGRIAVKVLYEEGQTTISILCSERRTMAMLGQKAGEIGAVMEQRLGDTTTVVVEERPTEDYQEGRGNNQAGRESEQERQREEQQKAKPEDNSHFLQRLRLGLAE